MIVDWEVYYDTACRCRQLAADLRAADKPVHEAVRNHCAGMAGDANGCKQWGESYDHAAHHTLQASASLANALTNYAAILAAQGYNWGIANRSNPPPPRPDTTQVAEYRVDLPTSVRDNGSGFAHSGGVKAFFDQLVTAVADRFGKLPNADAGKLDTAHSTWSTFANHPTVTGASATIAAVSGLFEGMDDPANRQLIQDHFATLKNSADNVVSGARNIAGPVGDYHSATVSFGDTTANRINWLEAGITAAAVAGVALAIFTVGMSAEAAGASIAAAVTATTTAIEEAFTASTLAEILGVTTLTLGAGVTVKAFGAVPVDDLERDASKLAAIIAMKVLIDDGSPGDDSERKQNPQGPGESPVWKDLKPYRGKTKTNGKNGKSREFYEWDYTHDDIEVYDSKGQHLGSMDPVSGKMYKPAVNGRKIPVG